MSDPASGRMSVEEYLRTEERSPFKREYVGGFVYPLGGQAGASQAHSLISGNIFAALHWDARAAGCRIHLADMRLFVDGKGTFVYPDVMLVCEQDVPDRSYETSPCLLVEVLSSSTASNDRVGKYALYTAIPTLQTSLIVEQAERRVYVYERQGEGWNLQELVGQGNVPIACLGRALSLDDVYGGVL